MNTLSRNEQISQDAFNASRDREAFFLYAESETREKVQDENLRMAMICENTIILLAETLEQRLRMYGG